jgi:GINS complex subunit 1
MTASASLYEQALRQNKRMLLAYTRHRFERLRFILWSLGVGSASIQLPDFVSRHIAPPEMKLRNRYQELVSNYRSKLGDLDLGSEDIPPKDVYVEVRVLKECGQVLTEDGIVRLSKGSMHHLKRSQVEKLVRAGFLMHVD